MFAQAKQWVAESDSLLVIGSSLTVFSAYRLVLHALDSAANPSVARRVFVLNDGPTRADPFLSSGRLTKLAARAEHVLPLAFS